MARWRRGSPVTNLQSAMYRRKAPALPGLDVGHRGFTSQRASHFTTCKPLHNEQAMAFFEPRDGRF
jgi:hypothetical protein